MNINDKDKTTDPKLPEHIEVARNLVKNFILKFEVLDQNELLKEIKSLLDADRVKQIENTASRLDFLKQSIEGLRTS